MRDEVLEDDLLDMAVLGVARRDRLERVDPLLRALPDSDQDAGRERDLELARETHRLESSLGVLGWRALVHDQVRVGGLEHQSLRRRHLTKPRQIIAR